MGWVVIGAAGGLCDFQLGGFGCRERRLPLVTWRIPARRAAGSAIRPADIYDVRSHGYFDAKAMRIRGSRRLGSAFAGTSSTHDSRRSGGPTCNCTAPGQREPVRAWLGNCAKTRQGKGARISR